ncbi:carbonic anhydrase [Mycena galopus ATCC 62051]|nr:carbonic anhydrase [Mycena galopus ATCC 62051]
MSTIAKDFLEANEKYAPTFETFPLVPKVLVVTCMDSRVHPYEQWGMKIGEGGIIRNGGGSAEEAINNILIVQQLFGGREIAIVHHTDCGMTKFTTEWMRNKIKEAHPGRDDIAKTIDAVHFHNFTDIEGSVKHDLKYLAENPMILKGTHVTGWVYDVETGKMSQVGDVMV